MAKNSSRLISFGASTMSLRRLSTEKISVKTSIKDGESSLYRRLSALGGCTDVNVGETINEWVKEGKSVNKSEIIGFVNQLRKYKKYNHAIQLLEWLEKKGRELSRGDEAVRLDLIAKAKGVDLAEKYFMSLPESSKNRLTYGALLNCYCKEKMKDKAMVLLEKMKELNFASSYLVYNSLISLHMKEGEPEKVPSLVQEMKKKNITPDVHTYSFLMNSYALLNDIERAEGVIEEMKKDGIKLDWSTYANLASIYVKAGNFKKANSTLKKIEKMKDLRDRKAYHILIGLYSRTSNKVGVNRVWDSLKSAFPKLTNICHLSRLQAFHRLGDTDGLKEGFKEWESSCSNYDIRLTNVLIDYYLSQDMVKEAEALHEDAVGKGGKPNFRTLEMFMNFYLKKHELDLALKYLETAASKVNENEWKPSQDVISMFLKYLEEEKDVDGAENFFKSLKKVKSIDSEAYDSLMRTYIAAGKREPHMRQRLKEDGIEINPISKNLLGRVCPE